MRHPSKSRPGSHRAGPQGRSQRQLRVGELVRHALAEILSRQILEDPALDGLIITVSEVRVSPDLKHATAFVAPLGGGADATERMLEGLKRCRKFLRGELGRRIEIKFTPELHFEADQSFDEASRMNALLRSDEVARDLDDDEDAGVDRGDDDDDDGDRT